MSESCFESKIENIHHLSEFVKVFVEGITKKKQM